MGVHTHAHMNTHVWGAVAGVSCCRNSVNSMWVKYGLLTNGKHVTSYSNFSTFGSLFLECWVLILQPGPGFSLLFTVSNRTGKCFPFQLPQFLLPSSDIGRRTPNGEINVWSWANLATHQKLNVLIKKKKKERKKARRKSFYKWVAKEAVSTWYLQHCATPVR